MAKLSAVAAMASVFVLLLGNLTEVTSSEGESGACSGSVLYCYGGRILRSVIRQLANERSLQLMSGVEIVRLEEEEEVGDDEVRDNEIDGGGLRKRGSSSWGVLNRVARYLTSHELKVNLGELMGGSELRNVVGSTLDTVQQEMARSLEGAEARGKKGKGYGAILMMGAMMGKLLGALGFGGVALLALKALGVSMVALLLSAILGLKKLTEGGGGGGGGHDHKGRQNDEDDEEMYRLSAVAASVDDAVEATEPMLMAVDGSTGTGKDSYQLRGGSGSGGVGNRKRRSPKDQWNNAPYRGWRPIV